jgi:hypothetical protein
MLKRRHDVWELVRMGRYRAVPTTLLSATAALDERRNASDRSRWCSVGRAG